MLLHVNMHIVRICIYIEIVCMHVDPEGGGGAAGFAPVKFLKKNGMNQFKL